MDTFSSTGFSRGMSAVLDFGSHWVGYLTLRVEASREPVDAPTFLKLRFCERACELSAGSAGYEGAIGRGWIQEEWLHLDVLPAVIRLPRRYAMRYLELAVLDTSPNYSLVFRALSFDAVSAVPWEAEPLCPAADPFLREIDAVSLRTLRSCMQEVFEDGPKRDRRLWLGDLRLQAMVNYETFRDVSLGKRCLYLFAGLVREDGAVASCVYPEPQLLADNIFLLDYSLLFIPTLLDYLSASGDLETAKALYPTAMRQLLLARRFLQPDGTVEPEGRYCCFVDWADGLDKQAAMHGIYLFCLRQAIALAQSCGEGADALRQWYCDGCRAANAFWASGFFVSGPNRQISWASQIWMCLGGVLSPQDASALLTRAARLPEILPMATPYLFHHYLQALLESGLQALARAELRRYWGGMVRAGADTFWELYDPENPEASPYGSCIVNSYCHAWSCTPAYWLRKYRF